MSLLSTVTTGVSRSGIRAVIGAGEKMGKTTLLSQAPNVLLVPCEIGYGGVACAKTAPITSWDQFINFLDQEVIPMVAAGQFPFRSIAIDSLTALERFLHEAIVQRDPTFIANGGKKLVTMEVAHGGYGKAYTLANTEFDMLLQRFDYLSTCGINVLCTAHVFSSTVKDPTAGEYEMWDILLHAPKNGKNYGKRERITQWADIIGFLYEPLFVSGGDDKKMSRATSQNKGRVLGLSRTPNYVAGNRFGIVGEIPLPMPPKPGEAFNASTLGWNAFANALYQTSGIDVFNRG